MGATISSGGIVGLLTYVTKDRVLDFIWANCSGLGQRGKYGLVLQVPLLGHFNSSRGGLFTFLGYIDQGGKAFGYLLG